MRPDFDSPVVSHPRQSSTPSSLPKSLGSLTRIGSGPFGALLSGCGEDEQRHARTVDEESSFDEAHGDEEGHDSHGALTWTRRRCAGKT
jgi:hypothetical protein